MDRDTPASSQRGRSLDCRGILFREEDQVSSRFSHLNGSLGRASAEKTDRDPYERGHASEAGGDPL
jgi:hypothetical protein